jgi:serine/threonine-protein kinase HipA
VSDGLLALYLRGQQVGEIQRLRNGRLRLRYLPEALDRWGEGARPLSLSLPLTRRRVEGPALDRYLDNLLPEGPSRAALEREQGVPTGDAFGLLTAVGAECAGAVQLLPPGSEPSAGRLRVLADDEVSRLVSDLPTLSPPDGLVVTASLGGIQAKLLLHRTDSGWAWPSDGAISTHLVKPEPAVPGGVPGLVGLEHWTLGLAAAAGMTVAHSELVEMDGREAIVVERYDRRDGRRLHQEDLAQALGIAAVDKYERSGHSPGRLASVARAAAAEAIEPATLLRDLLRLVTFNAVIGNGDAHAKNYSLLIDEEATVQVAPLYDAAPVFIVSSTYRHAGMAVAGRNRLDLIMGGHLVEEAVTWGLSESSARDVVQSTANAVGEALHDLDAPPGHPSVPEQMARRVELFTGR